jgi:VWFA-related protein
MNPPRIARAALAAASIACAAAAQTDPQPQPTGAFAGGFFETIDVNVVNVDVYVTDKHGEPVLDLRQEDFELREDGRPMPITNFYAVTGGRPVAGTDLAVAPPEAAPPVGGAAETPEPLPLVPEEQRLHLVVYIDNFNIRPFNRNRVFRRLREFLNNELTPEDRVMLVTYDRSLHRRHPFTSDSQLISQALFELETLTGHAVHQDSERRDLLRSIAEAEDVNEVLWETRTFAESTYNDLNFTVDAMREIVDSLAGLPGRKALLYVSDGIAMKPGEEMFYALLQKFGETSAIATSHEFDASRLFEQLADQANAHRVSFYTLDAAGLRPPTSSSAEVAELAQAGFASFYDSTLINNLQAPLRVLAEKTGGQAILNQNDVGPALNRVARDFDTYYSLGFTPSHSGSGRLFDIEVRVVGRKDLVVRHRSSYRDKPVGTRMADGTMATLLYGEQRNGLGIEVALGGETADVEERDLYLVTVVVHIPIASLTLIPRDEFHLGRAKVFFAAMDEGGGLSEVQEVPVDVRIPEAGLEEALAQQYAYEVQLRMRPGPHRLAVGVLDEVASEAAFVSRSFVVGKA